jgi:hypothetical protein
MPDSLTKMRLSAVLRGGGGPRPVFDDEFYGLGPFLTLFILSMAIDSLFYHPCLQQPLHLGLTEP